MSFMKISFFKYLRGVLTSRVKPPFRAANLRQYSAGSTKYRLDSSTRRNERTRRNEKPPLPTFSSVICGVSGEISQGGAM